MNIDLDVIIYLSGAVAAIAAAVGIISNVIKKTIKNVSGEVIKSTLSECHKRISDEISNLNKKLNDYSEKSAENDELLKNALMNLIKARINQEHTSYAKKSTIGAYSLATLDELYVSYKQLGGNSFIEHEMNDLHSLRVVSAEELTKGAKKNVGENQDRNA